MVIVFLGIMDLLAALFMLFMHFDILQLKIGILLGLYLIVKGIMFRHTFVSIIDVVAGIYMILLVFGFRTFLTYIFVLYLLQKGLFSLKS